MEECWASDRVPIFRERVHVTDVVDGHRRHDLHAHIAELALSGVGELDVGAKILLVRAGHLATELLLSMTKTSMVHIPYKGTGPGLVDVVGGQVTMMMPTVASRTLR